MLEEDQEKSGAPMHMGDYRPPAPGGCMVWDEGSDPSPCNAGQIVGGFDPQVWKKAPDYRFSGEPLRGDPPLALRESRSQTSGG